MTATNIPVGHERQITFFPSNGHNHDGENSTIVDLQPGQVRLNHLDPALLEWLKSLLGDGTEDSDDFLPVPDLLFETNAVGPGGSITGSIDWTGISVVRFMRVYMSTDSECQVTFYHKATYADEDREFRARRCSNKFLWEGAWVHYDEDETKKIHYKIENTGTQTTRFQIHLKSGTLVANGYARFVESLQVQGSSTASFIGNVLLQAGNGITITPDANATMFRFDAVAPEIINVDRWGMVPFVPTSVTSSASLVYNTGGSANQLDGITTDYTRYVTFGTGYQWIQYDFGAIRQANGVSVMWYYGDSRSFLNTKIEISADANNWINVYDTASTKGLGPPGAMVNMPTAINCRYVRVWTNGSTTNTSNHIVKCILYAQTNKVGT